MRTDLVSTQHVVIIQVNLVKVMSEHLPSGGARRCHRLLHDRETRVGVSSQDLVISGFR